jgi:tripartite-type tricarboxylate transporter receptor subunit TctC
VAPGSLRRRPAVLGGLLAATLALCSTAATAQPATSPVTLVVPVPPGGILDQVARMVQANMGRALGQTVVVDNRAGASGNIAATAVARAKPDGQTLLVGYSMFHVGNPAMFDKLAWDPVRDFAPVAMLVVSPHVVAVHPSVPATTLKELVDLARAKPGTLNYATSGNGSVPHVGMELFKQQAKIDVVHVPYKGAGPAMQDVVAGNVQMTIATPPSLLGMVQTGKLRALAVAAKTRHPLLPNVPTTAEAGYPNFELEAWVALLAPAGTPPAAVARLSSAAQQALQSPEVRKAADAAGVEIRYQTPEQLDRQVRKDIDYWGQIIRQAGIKAE